jgi:lipoyl(octanoyl) transferase
MRSLEEVVLSTLQEYSITGIRVPGKTGVWIDEHSKIAFCGVRISRWCTLHGFSLNVLPCSDRFASINPCGLGKIKIASISELISPQPVSVAEVTHKLIAHFIRVFNYEV